VSLARRNVGPVRGHMRQRSKGTWELRAFAGRDPVTGRDRYKTRTVKGGKRAAEEALAAFVTQVGAGVATGNTFGELVERWFAVASVAKDWSPKTILETRRVIDGRLGPLWPLRLDKLRTSVLDDYYAALRAHGGRCGHRPLQAHGRDLCERGAPLSAATVRRTHVIVHAALEQAVAWEWIVVNPASKASPGRVDTPEIKPPTVDEVLALLRAAEKEDLDLAVFLVVAAVTGARRGELCALRWTDVDLEEGTVTIRRVISQGPDGLVERNKPKTRGSLRTLSVDSGTVAVLRAHRARCAERAEACGVTLPANAFLFSHDPEGSAPWRPDSTSRRFAALRDAVGLDQEIHLHGLRHFVVTTLLGAGVELPQVAGRVGHGGGGKTTLAVYSHFQARRDREVAELLGRMLRDPSKGD
jgi:integrase